MRKTIEFNFYKVIFNETDGERITGEGIHRDYWVLYKMKGKLVSVLRDLDNPSRDFLSFQTTQFSIIGYKEDFCLIIKPRFPPCIYYISKDYTKVVSITDRGICSFFKRFLTERGYL